MKPKIFLDIKYDPKISAKFLFDEPQPTTCKKDANLIPVPIFCLKAQDLDKNKIFINFCVSESISEPRTTNEYEVTKYLSEGRSDYAIPAFVGAAHDELDHDGQAVQTYDVIVNPIIKLFSTEVGLTKTGSETLSLWTNIIENMICDSLNKFHSVTLCSDFKFRRLKNKKSFGHPKPIIDPNVKSKLIEDITDKIPQDSSSYSHYDVFFGTKWNYKKVGDNKTIMFIHFFQESQHDFQTGLKLHVADSCIKLTHKNRNGVFSNLRIVLPFTINISQSKSTFNEASKILEIEFELNTDTELND